VTGHHEPGEEYAGEAVISADGVDVPVEVQLRGAFQPIDGRFHWYGRVAATDALELPPGSSVTLRTAHGAAQARLADVDTWGRLRVTGLGRPPF
jgi:hypothetical protein